MPQPAAWAQDTGGKAWALLIGVERYERATPLRYTINDVVQIGRTLAIRGDYDPSRILQITDDVTDPSYRPTKQSLMEILPGWLKRPAPQDQILVYFSGHGFRDKDGKGYLAPIDVDPADPASTGIPIQWLREQLAACPAGFKLLVLDACHAGVEKGDDDGPGTGVSAEVLGESFRSLERVVTLASSTADQKSQIWLDKEQSLFSYWLNQALKGHADGDSDGNVDIDELYKYVSRMVRQTADARLHRKQQPVRIVRSGTYDVPVVERLKPQRLKAMLADMAEQLADTMIEQDFKKVGVLEFSNDTRLGELLGANFGLLGKFCADELERGLTAQGKGKFSLVDKSRLKESLESEGFSLRDLHSTARMAQLSKGVGNMPLVALGTLRNRKSAVVALQCKLVRTDTIDEPAVVGGTCLLNENEWAMTGASAIVDASDYRPPPPSLDGPPQPMEEQLISRLDERAKGPHPLVDPSFKFGVKIMVHDAQGTPVERPGVVRGNDYIVSLRKGEVYEIWIENNSGDLALLRLLVDGLNTLPQSPTGTKGVALEIVGPRVSLDDARAWELDPNFSKLTAIRGFVTKTGPQGKLKEFTVVDADKSLAARQKFTDQVGMITAAFYANKTGGARGGIGTAAGREISDKIPTAHGYLPGRLLGVVNIRYVDADLSK